MYYYFRLLTTAWSARGGSPVGRVWDELPDILHSVIKFMMFIFLTVHSTLQIFFFFFFFAERTPGILIRNTSTTLRETRYYKSVPEDPTHCRHRRGARTRRAATAAGLLPSQRRLDEEQYLSEREVVALILPDRTAGRRGVGEETGSRRRGKHRGRRQRSRARP